MTTIYVDDKQGNVYEIPHGKVTIIGKRSGRAGSLEFEYYKGDVFSQELNIIPGMVIRFEKDGQVLFYGYVFKVSNNKVLCYDQIRYLKYKDTKVFENKKASQIVEEIAKENQLTTGIVKDTKYILNQASEQKEYLDMINEALQETLLNIGRLYFLRDNSGQLELLDIADTKLDLIIDGDGCLTDYELSSEIDTDTYNVIKLVRNNHRDKGLILPDIPNVIKWGKLQYHELVDDSLNDAQIREKANTLLELKNREKKTFTIQKAVGDFRCRSGFSVFISIPEEGINSWYLINSDKHTFDQNVHTMDLELVVY